MTVAYDAFSSGVGANTYSFTHTPVGTPRAVIVYTTTGGASDVTAVSYGGVAMTQMTGSPNNLSSGTEQGNVTGWFLGASIPTGAQSVQVTSGAATKIAYCNTLTGAADTEIVDVDATINSTSQANPSVVLSLGGRTCFASICVYSGQDAAGSVTPLTSWTSRNETDLGAQILAYYTYDTVGSTDVTSGWTQAADDALAITAAISEIVTATYNHRVIGGGFGGRVIG